MGLMFRCLQVKSAMHTIHLLMGQTSSFVVPMSYFCNCFVLASFSLFQNFLCLQKLCANLTAWFSTVFPLRIFHHSSAGKQNWGHWRDGHGCSIWFWSCQFALQLSIPFHQVINCTALFNFREKELTFVFTMAFHLQMSNCPYVIATHCGLFMTVHRSVSVSCCCSTSIFFPAV